MDTVGILLLDLVVVIAVAIVEEEEELLLEKVRVLLEVEVEVLAFEGTTVPFLHGLELFLLAKLVNTRCRGRRDVRAKAVWIVV